MAASVFRNVAQFAAPEKPGAPQVLERMRKLLSCKGHDDGGQKINQEENE
jgi:hypothetical protein